MIRAAKNAPERIVIDGCPVGCAKRIMDAHQVPVDRYLIVTELGIRKTHEFDVEDGEVQIIAKEARRPQEKAPPTTP